MTEPITYGQTLIHQGGLMRCCLGTIAMYVADHFDEPIVDGLVLDCHYEVPNNRQIILTDTIWHWNNPPQEARPS